MKKRIVLLASLLYSPLVSAAELDFFEAIEHILAKDRNLDSQNLGNTAELVTLEADRKSAYPTLNASVVHSINREWQSNSYPHSSYWQADLGINLYRFGQDEARYRLATKGDRRYAAARDHQILDAEKAAADKALAYVFSALDLKVLEKIRVVRQRLLDVSNKQYGRGLLPVQEVKKVELDLRSIDLQIKRGQVQVDQAKIELQRYLAQDELRPDWPVTVAEQALKIPLVSKDHPQLMEAEEAVAMSREEERILWAAQYPSVDASAVNYRSLSGEAFDSGHTNFLVSLTVPILDRAVSRSLYRAQGERANAAAANLDWIRENLKVQNASSRAALQENASNIAVYEELTVTARQLYQDSLGRFERGLITVNDLSVDEARYYSAERERVQSWYALSSSWVSACQASGLRLRACRALGVGAGAS